MSLEVSEVRIAGGRAGEALRSIICVDHLLGVGAVVVIHHTGKTSCFQGHKDTLLIESLLDCGLTHLRNDYLRSSLTEKAPNNASEIAKMEFGEILE